MQKIQKSLCTEYNNKGMVNIERAKTTTKNIVISVRIYMNICFERCGKYNVIHFSIEKFIAECVIFDGIYL